MAKISPNNITSLTQDWGNDTSVNLPFSGAAVQSFIKSYLGAVAKAAWFNPADYKMYWFASENDSTAFQADNTRTDLVLFSTAMSFASELYRVLLTNNNGTTNLNVATNETNIPISIDFAVQKKAMTDVQWTTTNDGCYVTLQVDAGSTGTYVTVLDASFYSYGTPFIFNIRDYLIAGQNRVKVQFVSENDDTVISSLVYSVTMSEMYIELMNNEWYVPIVEGGDTNAYKLGGFKIVGAVSKTLHLDLYSNSANVKSFSYAVGTTSYASVPFYYTSGLGFDIVDLPTGVYLVDAYLTSGTLTSPHVQYNIMHVSEADIATAQLVTINEVADLIYNYSSSNLFKYAVYNKGLSTGTPHIIVREVNGTSSTTIVDETLSEVATGVAQDYSLSLEWLTEDTLNLSVLTIMTYGNEQTTSVPVDNSLTFPPTSGFSFYMNAATRSNSNANRLKLVNLANNAELTPTWTRMAWMDGIDGWTLDSEEKKALYLPAGSFCRLPYSQYQMIGGDGITLEFCYKVSNVSDYDEPVITICDDLTAAGFRGVKIKPTNVTVHSSSDSTAANDINRGTNLMDEKIVHLLITIYPNFKGNTGKNLVTGYVNGAKNFQFEYATGSVWATEGDLILGSSSADLSVYFVRAYRSILSDAQAQTNYISSIGSITSRRELSELFKSVMNSSETEISYENVKNNRYNFFVLEMLNGATVPSRANGWDKEDKGRGNLEMHFGEHPEWDWKLFNIETMGQGTTSMNYYRWNIRWRIDKTDTSKKVGVAYLSERATSATGSYSYIWGSTVQSKTVRFDGQTHPAVKRITAKINSASSMHSHKIGATRAYSELHDAIGLQNEAQAYAANHSLSNPTLAVYQYPAYGFVKNGDNYEFIGIFTIGPDKGDKPTFGWDIKDEDENFSIPAGLISLEGTDHERKMVMFNYPWNEDVIYLDSNKCINIVKGTGSYDAGWEVGNCNDLDVGSSQAADQTAINEALEREFKPAYDLVFNNSTMLVGIELADANYGASDAAGVLARINTDITEFIKRLAPDGRVSMVNYQFWIEGEYTVYYYDIKDSIYKSTGINLVSDFGQPTASTVTEQNEWFKAKRRERFMASAENYWHIGEAIYHYVFLLIFGSMDNFGKNSYPYKMKPLADGGRWRWRQDDLDSMAGIGNLGMDNMPYWMEFADTNAGNPYFGGSASAFWNLIHECYMDDYVATSTTEVSIAGSTAKGIFSVGQDVLSAMASIAGIGGGMLNGVLTYIKLRFWDNAQNYFPQSAYNADAAFKYEAGWLDSSYGGVSLAQSLGNHYEAEYLWFYRRIIYMMSFFKAGPFGSYANSDLGLIKFRTLSLTNPTVTPAMPLYPAFAAGTTTVSTGRTWAGTPYTFVGSFGDGQQDSAFMATDLLSSLGDLKDFRLGTNYITDTLTIQGKKLTSFKIGDETEPVTTNVQTIAFSDNYCLLTIDARNASSISGSVNLSACTRLRSAYFGGTSITNIALANGQKIETLQLPDTTTSLILRNLSFLTDLQMPSDLSHIELIQIQGCPNQNAFEMLHDIYTETGSSLRYISLADSMTREVAADRILELASIAERKDYEGHTVNYGGVTPTGAANPSANPGIEGELRLTTGMHEASMESLGITSAEDYGDGLKRALASYFGALYIIYDPVNIYMTFADSTVESLAADAWGDGTGLSEVQAKRVTSAVLDNVFKGNTSITTFNELQYFTGLTTFGNSSHNASPFYGCTNLTSIVIPSTVTVLNAIITDTKSNWDGAFVGNLTSVTLPTSIQVIGGGTFSHMKLTDMDINLPNLTSIGGGAFRHCGIGSISSLGYVTSLGGASAFQNCTRLSTVVLPNTLVTIDANAFVGCTSLTSVNFDELLSLTTIGTTAFTGCTRLNGELYFPALTSLGSRAFENTKITKIRSLGSLTSIPASSGTQGAFYGCTSLTEVVLPNTLRSIGANAFYNCTSLASVSGAADVTTIDQYAFQGCSALTGTLDLSSTTTIGSQAFQGTALTGVTFSALTSLGNYAFRNCASLSSITLPATVTSISTGVFNGCSGLTSCSILATTPPTADTTSMIGVPTFIKVPDASVYAYMTATGWKRHRQIVGSAGNNIHAVTDGVMTTYTANVFNFEADANYSVTDFIPLAVATNQITISCGFVYDTSRSACIMLFDSSLTPLGYFDVSADPRTITPSTAGAGVAYIRMTVKSSELASCYVYDETGETYLWKGSEVTTHYTVQ